MSEIKLDKEDKIALKKYAEFRSAVVEMMELMGAKEAEMWRHFKRKYKKTPTTIDHVRNVIIFPDEEDN